MMVAGELVESIVRCVSIRTGTTLTPSRITFRVCPVRNRYTHLDLRAFLVAFVASYLALSCLSFDTLGAPLPDATRDLGGWVNVIQFHAIG